MKTFANQNARTLDEAVALAQAAQRDGPVSYTHLTLPTILLV